MCCQRRTQRGANWWALGYSNSNLAVQQADLETLEWVTAAGLTEVADEQLQATWKPNLVQKRAVLYRKFLGNFNFFLKIPIF